MPGKEGGKKRGRREEGGGGEGEGRRGRREEGGGGEGEGRKVGEEREKGEGGEGEGRRVGEERRRGGKEREGRGKKDEVLFHLSMNMIFELESISLPLIRHCMWGEPQCWRVSHEGLCGPQYSQPLWVIV